MEVQTGRFQERDTQEIVIPAPGAGKYNILESLVVTGTAAAVIAIESPRGTIVWDSQLFLGGGGFTLSTSRVWGAENSELIIRVSAGTYTISVGGIIVREQ